MGAIILWIMLVGPNSRRWVSSLHQHLIVAHSKFVIPRRFWSTYLPLTLTPFLSPQYYMLKLVNTKIYVWNTSMNYQVKYYITIILNYQNILPMNIWIIIFYYLKSHHKFQPTHKTQQTTVFCTHTNFQPTIIIDPKGEACEEMIKDVIQILNIK